MDGKPKRLIFLVLALLLCSLGALIAVSLSWLNQDRADLVAWFSKDRLAALTGSGISVEYCSRISRVLSAIV